MGVKQQDPRILEQVTKNVLQAVEKSRSEMVEIYAAARQETETLQRELKQITGAIAEVERRQEDLENEERDSRLLMVDVSRNSRLYDQANVVQVYEKARELQVQLALAAADRRSYMHRQDMVETRLKMLAGTLEKVAGIIAQMELVLGFMDDEMSDVCTAMETLQQRQEFGARIIRAQEEERRRLARDIHDGPAQTMANVVFRAEVCERLLTADPTNARKELLHIKEQTRQGLKEIREVIFNLRPMTLDDLGLMATGRRLLDALAERTGIVTELRVQGKEARLESTLEIALFRLLQEAIQNVEKHSQATSVSVTVSYGNGEILMTVQDNGVGFDPETVIGEHFGLLGMRERVSLLQGDFSLASQQGQGVGLEFRIPLPNVTTMAGRMNLLKSQQNRTVAP